jgi:hypothetical protein
MMIDWFVFGVFLLHFVCSSQQLFAYATKECSRIMAWACPARTERQHRVGVDVDASQESPLLCPVRPAGIAALDALALLKMQPGPGVDLSCMPGLPRSLGALGLIEFFPIQSATCWLSSHSGSAAALSTCSSNQLANGPAMRRQSI